MKYAIVFFIALLASLSLQAQQTTTWKGGTPGRETDWYEARNWSTYQIPDAGTHVLIKALHTGHYAMPVIDEHIQVASVSIFPGASLHITIEGSLEIDGSEQYSEGIINYGGNLHNLGLITLNQIEGDNSSSNFAWVTGTGTVLLDDIQLATG